MWQIFRLVVTLEEGRYDGAYGTRVGRAVGMSTRLAVDRADVQAGAAADAVKRLLELRAEQLGAAVVHEDKMKLFGTVEFARLPGSRDEVGVDRELLPGAAACE